MKKYDLADEAVEKGLEAITNNKHKQEDLFIKYSKLHYRKSVILMKK